MMKFGRIFNLIFINILNVVKEYCQNSSLAGVGYIVNTRLHFSERIFWVICITLSSYGSYHLIKDYLDSFNGNAISLVIENVSPHEIAKFPSLGLCELGERTYEYKRIMEVVHSLKENESIPYNEDVEQFILELTFSNFYRTNQLGKICEELLIATNSMKCPTGNYSKLLSMCRTQCKNMFVSCKWNGISFNCCQHFLPLLSTMGECYILNSIQTKDDESKWINLIADWDNGNGLLEITISRPITLYILNEEDIPFNVFNELTSVIQKKGTEINLRLNIKHIINDSGVRNVPQEYRKCIFPDENPVNSSYKYYSFTTCITDCIKRLQIKICNCSHHDLITKENDKSQACNLDGIRCLDNYNLIKVQTKDLQPWNIHGTHCECLPSCNEHEITIIQKTTQATPNKDIKVTLALQALPTEQFRRQAVRGIIDIVVTVGGILGLFMGASIISIIEFIYFLTYRIINYIFRFD